MSIRYGIHFAALAVSAVVLWFAEETGFPRWTRDWEPFPKFGLIGMLHATSLTVAVRDRRSVLHALGFVSLASVLSAATPWLGWFGNLLWLPVNELLNENTVFSITFLGTSSAIGAFGYWLLVQQFWFSTFRRTDLLRTIGLCVTATISVVLFVELAPPAKPIDSIVFFQSLTVAWWLAFSTSLAWSEGGGGKTPD